MVEIILRAEIKSLNEYTELTTNEKKYIITALIENTGKQFKFEWKNRKQNAQDKQAEFNQLQNFITKFNRKVSIVTELELHELDHDGMYAIELATNEDKALTIKRLITDFENYQIDLQEEAVLTKEIEYENGSIDEVIIKESEDEIEGITIDGSKNPQDLYFKMKSSEDEKSVEVDNTIAPDDEKPIEIEKYETEQIEEKESEDVVEELNEEESHITAQESYKKIVIDSGFDSPELNEFVNKFDLGEGPINDYFKCLVLYSTTQKHSYYEFVKSFKKLTTVSPITEEPFFVDVMRKRLFSDPIKEKFISIKRKITEEDSQEQLLNKLAEVLNKLEDEVNNNDN